MGLYTPMHPCIINCQFWKVNWKVQLSLDSAISRAHYAQNWTHIRASFDEDNPENFILKLSLNLTVLRFKTPGIQDLLCISFYFCKHSEWDQARAKARAVESRSPLKVFSRKFYLFDSLLILLNSLDSLVVWSPTNVGKKIELLRG